MAKKHHFRLYLALAAILCISIQAFAFSASKYAPSSKLASGHWVKVKVDKNGIYELTYDELQAMGFNTPSKVRIYGQGGHVISESLNGNQTDDLIPVPYDNLINNKKVVFYAKGPVKMSLSTATPYRFSRSINTYSTAGYYFITESSTGANKIKNMSSPTLGGSNLVTTSLNYAYHESESMSYLSSGKDLYGETLPAEISMDLYGRSEGTSMVVQTAVAVCASSSAGTSLTASIGNDEVPFTSASFTAPAGYDKFKLIQPYAVVSPTTEANTYKLNIGVADATQLSYGALDYAIVTYTQDNALGAKSQVNMFYGDITSDDKIGIYHDSNLQIWNVSDPQTPLRVSYRNTTITEEFEGMQIETEIDEASLGINGAVSLVAFDPTKNLYKISEYEQINNQNLHGAPTPDMVIICPTILLEQAERLAQIHRDHDNYDVLVVDQQDVFNEFSSGTPDGMAYRLMLKMFYDRDPQKIKHLLLFGGGYFDNRQLSRTKGDNYLLTYQSTNSYNSISTYVSDDFFGTLADNTGLNLTSEAVSIGVGRLPVLNPEEASNMVDKIEAYINDTDYSNWRNKILIMDESGDDNIHIYQGADLLNTLSGTSSADIDVKKLHIAAYTLVESAANPVYATGNNNVKASVLQLAEFFQQGLLFATYMGHGGGGGISKTGVWSTNNVMDTPLSRLPIMSMAACDIANFDSDIRGIGEIMVLTPGRGAIGLFTTTRTVEANENQQCILEITLHTQRRQHPSHTWRSIPLGQAGLRQRRIA